MPIGHHLRLCGPLAPRSDGQRLIGLFDFPGLLNTDYRPSFVQGYPITVLDYKVKDHVHLKQSRAGPIANVGDAKESDGAGSQDSSNVQNG